MSEEEKKSIKDIKELVFGNISEITIYDKDGYTMWNNDLETLLKLIEKQQKEIENQNKLIDYHDMWEERDLVCELQRENKYLENKVENSIEISKIKEILGIDDKLNNDKIFSLLETMVSEFNRLENIEDKKIQVDYNFVFNKGVDSVKKKIEDKIKEYRQKRIDLANGHFFEDGDNINQDNSLFVAIEILKLLLEEE